MDGSGFDRSAGEGSRGSSDRSGSREGDAASDASHDPDASTHGPTDPDINDLLAKLDALSDTVDGDHEREKVRQTISLVERMPGSAAFTTRITKYTSRDMAESFVGAVLFSLPCSSKAASSKSPAGSPGPPSRASPSSCSRTWRSCSS